MAIGKNLNLKRDRIIPEKRKETRPEDKKVKLVEKEESFYEKPIESVQENGAEVESSQAQKMEVDEQQEESFKINVIPSKRTKVRKIRVELSGKLDITNISKINNRIKPLFSDYDLVDFIIKETKHLDLTLIQMLYNYKHFYNDGANKIINIKSELPNNLSQLMRTNNLLDFVSQEKTIR